MRFLIVFLIALAVIAGACDTNRGQDEPTTTSASPSESAMSPTTTMTAAGITITAAIPYMENAETYSPQGTRTGLTVALDRYEPAGDGPWPIVVIVHGGAGDTREKQGPLAEAVAARGAVVYAPTYLGNAPPSIDQMKSGQWTPEENQGDIACAVRFALADALQHHGDPDRLVLVGSSMGGRAAALVALAGDDLQVTGETAGICLTLSGSVMPTAFVGLDGPYDWVSFAQLTGPELFAVIPDPELFERISPLNYVAASAPKPPMSFNLVYSVDPPFAEYADLFASSLSAAGYPTTTLQVDTNHVGLTGGVAPLNPNRVPEVVDLILDAANG